MTRFLADENFPQPSVRLLRRAGHDVAAMAEDAAGADDRDVLARAGREHRVLLTFDRDYGELIFRVGLPAPMGVVYIRIGDASPEEPAAYVLDLLAIPGWSLDDRFTVVERAQARQRPLP